MELPTGKERNTNGSWNKKKNALKFSPSPKREKLERRMGRGFVLQRIWCSHPKSPLAQFVLWFMVHFLPVLILRMSKLLISMDLQILFPP
jgi:hypothetical protein